ncbi:MAG TPA: pyridoxal phosphate-dependent aminotransferase family protein [Thermoanaerobaculia bacterium]|nr:pyridoxal phosphate-dependent aminotransferase family protein [Thermoanaerobaculia bacterium]
MPQTLSAPVEESSAPRRLDGPFDGFFDPETAWNAEYRGLLDHRAARRWLDVVAWGAREDLYTFQQALDGKSGPRVEVGGQTFTMLSSYDYLGLIGHPDIEAGAISAIRDFGTGTGGVRLLTGTNTLHRRLEERLAAFKRAEAAITFTSGYTANLAVFAALLGPRDRAVVDERIHRSILDALRMAGVPYCTFGHNDPDALRDVLREKAGSRRSRTLIAVEGVYSMDGDLCPLPEIVRLKQEHGAFLLVDEAHALGVLGHNGHGADEHFGLPADAVDLWTGSLSKAVPANGGYLAGSRQLILYLQHGSAPFMFSAALCPAAAGAALAALDVIEREPERRSRLWGNVAYLHGALRGLGYDVGSSASPVIPVHAGADESAYRLARHLFDHGVLASAVVFPAVPPGSARLRLCATAAQDRGLLEAAMAAFAAYPRP